MTGRTQHYLILTHWKNEGNQNIEHLLARVDAF